MAITVKDNSFYLETDDTSYVFCVDDGFPVHLYYGKRVGTGDLTYLIDRQIYSFFPQKNDDSFQLSSVALEYSGFNTGDYRIPAIKCECETGIGCRLFYAGYEIRQGAPEPKGLPRVRGEDAETLVIKLRDEEKRVSVELFYAVFEKENVIARHAEIINDGVSDVKLDKAASVQLDFLPSEQRFDAVYFSGAVNDEFKVERRELAAGIFKIGSTKGFTSHAANPFFCLADKFASEDSGDAYAFNLLYSGGFSCEVELDELRKTRFVAGINPETFDWLLAGGERFVTPQAILTYSSEGIGGISRNFHNVIRNRIMPGRFAFASRPIVVNTWEAFNVNVDEKKVLALADYAKKMNIDTVVLDDGWFRSDNKSGLGEWKEDKAKFPSGIAALAEKVREKGLNFGLWIEPEMVSDGCLLMRERPEWVLRNGNEIYEWRYQHVLDFANPEVTDYVYNLMFGIITRVKPSYVKWDANRYLSCVGSRVARIQGETWHRYVLGVYSLLRRLTEAFPNVLFESCAGGGGRVDAGMLFYTPQIWISDCTRPSSRNAIQSGASLAYPPSAISSHFTEAGKFGAGFRYLVASFGAYGYEFDVTKVNNEQAERIAEFGKKYREEEKFVLRGDLYRLTTNRIYQADMQVLPDKSAALVRFLLLNVVQGKELAYVRLCGLDPNAYYKNSLNDLVIRGDSLMNAGIFISDLNCVHPTNSGRQLFFNEYKEIGGGVKILFEKV